MNGLELIEGLLAGVESQSASNHGSAPDEELAAKEDDVHRSSSSRAAPVHTKSLSPRFQLPFPPPPPSSYYSFIILIHSCLKLVSTLLPFSSLVDQINGLE